ncbi:MAG: hypothetical protein LR015_12910 [Verrucomicrobia bacterium]|nr:hypothetical protein [Verrucomicrobiota bacterium]
MSSTTQFIGFPPPLLGPDPQRLAVLWHDGPLFVLEKPANVLVMQDPWYPRFPALEDAINFQAAAGKPELERLGLDTTGLGGVFGVDPEMTGVAFLAAGAEATSAWAEVLGSDQFLFRYVFVASGQAPAEQFTSELPLARHRQEKRVVVSHTTGKKSRSDFRRLERWGKWSFWEVVTHYPRFHQVRVHAAESGLKVLGDALYGDPRPIFLSNLKRDYRPGRTEERPLFEGLALHLNAVQFADLQGNKFTVEAPTPGKLQNLCRRLREYAR